MMFLRPFSTAAADAATLHQIKQLTLKLHRWRDELEADAIRIKGGYKPSQPRVPRGNPDGGQWTDGGGGSDTGGASSRRVAMPARKPAAGVPSKPIKPLRPILNAEELARFNRAAPAGTPAEDLEIDPMFGLPRWYVGGAVSPTVSPLDLIGQPVRLGMQSALREAQVLLRLRRLREERGLTGALTDHGEKRFIQRGVTDKDIDNAVASAIRTGQTVTKKGGSYNQLQTHYKGSNGLTVIIADEGRKAGQVITVFGKKSGGKL